ncbi:MAG: FAD-binding oxidoreductase [Candidatus Latescibacterota bacterium]|nr:MAG: FAD-binding oxidoreductase [Candidatus Latescibacterota bacterium]
MTVIGVETLAGETLRIDQSDLNVLTANMRGSLLLPGAPGYDDARTIWNGMIDRRPAVIARCIGAADVMACVAFARERGIRICIKGGGHNIAGLAVSEGAMMIDMSLMRGVWVDPKRRIAHAQAGCTLGDVDRDTQLHGLAAVLGFVSNTGITGLTLGGGFGYLTRRYGWTSDNVRSFELITADGRLRRVSDAEDPDLFWGLRGGGGNFGVVTGIEYDLYDVGPQIMGGAIAWRAEHAAEVLEMFREVNENSPPEHVCVAAIRPAPPAPWLPKEIHGKLVVALFVCDTGPIEEAEKRVNAIKSFGSPLGDIVQKRLYCSQQNLLDATQPNGRRYYWKSEYLPGVEDGLLEKFVNHGERIVSPHSAILLFPLHGALSNLPEEHSAVGNRETGMVFNVAGSWEKPEDDKANIAWARNAWKDMREFSTGGTYINFLNAEEGDDRIRDAYGKNYDRLVEIKTKCDPQNIFRANKNIVPKS